MAGTTAFLLAGCQKEVLTTEATELAEIDKMGVVALEEKGALVFESESELYASLEKLSSLRKEDRLKFERKHNFKSLSTIYEEVNEAEFQNAERIFKGMDPNLSGNEYEAMGYHYEPTALLNEYLEKGVIVDEIEADGSHAFHLSMNNPGFSNVLNEEGIVYAGDKKYLFENSEMKVYQKGTNILLHHVSTNTQTELTSGWSKSVDWQMDGNNRRFKYKVYGSCITSSETSPSGIIETSFYVQAEGENRVFGIWGKRSSYMPVYSFSGNWTSQYYASSSLYGQWAINPVNLIDNDYSSPFSWHSASDPYGQTNNFLRYLRPNGAWALSGWYIQQAMDVHYNMTFTFSGGSNGFVRTLSM